MRIVLAFLLTFMLFGCTKVIESVPVEPPKVVVYEPKDVIVKYNECKWASPIYISQTTRNILKEHLQNPDVSADIKKIFVFNELYKEYCNTAKEK